ncbi:MAG TPA: TfoX/Sxy family protein [Telluria sp.]
MPFSVNDRDILLAVKGVGPTVIARLEQMGYSDLEQLSAANTQDIVKTAAALLGSSCWKNSPQAKAAIEAAIYAAAAACKATEQPALVDLPLGTEHGLGELERVANLGPKSAAILAGAGIDSVEHLARLGSVAAFAMVRRSGARVSLNLLWAMEGALTGQSWQTVAREHRASLLLALDSYGTGD